MSAVSRETPDAETVRALFPDKTIYQFVDILIDSGIRRGVLGPAEASRVWSRHIVNCAVIAPLFAEGADVCDVGSGAGLPGIVVALARPDLHMVLMERQARRTRFLREVVSELALARTDVWRGRAQEGVADRRFDYVVARAVASLGNLAEWCLPLCRPGGELIAIKGSSAPEELRAAEADLRSMGAGRARIEKYGHGVVTPPTTIVRIESGTAPRT